MTYPSFGRGMTRLALALAALTVVSASAFADCQAPEHRKGELWLFGDPPVYTVSIALSDFTPVRLVCLAAQLKREHRRERHFAVFVFSSHEAAKCYHGPFDIGDFEGTFRSQKEANCFSAAWSSRQLHAVYSYHYDDESEYLQLGPFGLDGGDQRGITRIDLPTTTLSPCMFNVAGRCVITMEFPWAVTYPDASSGSVTLTARFTREGVVRDINVAEVRDMATGNETAIVRAAVDNLKSWRVEPAQREDTLRITYSHVIDPSLQPGHVELEFDVPRQITVRARSMPR